MRRLHLLFGILGCLAAQVAVPELAAQPVAAPPAFVLGRFVDDYDISYVVTPELFQHGTRTRYRIVEWHVAEQFFVAQQVADSTGRAPWVRVDWLEFTGMPPYTWGYCFTKYDAASAEIARAAPPAQRETPRTGCGGFPFSRMRRIDPEPDA